MPRARSAVRTAGARSSGNGANDPSRAGKRLSSARHARVASSSRHRPSTHAGDALGAVARHETPHALQFDTLVRTSTSHPVAIEPSQFAKDGLHWMPHAPLTHVAVAFGPAGQT